MLSTFLKRFYIFVLKCVLSDMWHYFLKTQNFTSFELHFQADLRTLIFFSTSKIYNQHTKSSKPQYSTHYACSNASPYQPSRQYWKKNSHRHDSTHSTRKHAMNTPKHQHINSSASTKHTTHQHNTSTHRYINASARHFNTSTLQHFNTSTHQHITQSSTRQHIDTLKILIYWLDPPKPPQKQCVAFPCVFQQISHG